MKKRLQQMEQETFSMQGNPKEAAGPQNPEKPAVTPAQNTTNGTPVDPNHAPATEAGAPAPPNPPVDDGTSESDARSIYVGNVSCVRTFHFHFFFFYCEWCLFLIRSRIANMNCHLCQYLSWAEHHEPVLQCQVDYKATGEELNQFFKECGTINRVTIMCHKATGQPKGFAYIEFKERESVQNALVLNEALFLGRPIKVVEKRTNIPALHRGGYRGRVARYVRGWRGSHGRRPRGRGRGRGRWAPY